MEGVQAVRTAQLARIVAGVNIVTAVVRVACALEGNQKEDQQNPHRQYIVQILQRLQVNARQLRKKEHNVAVVHDQEDIVGNMGANKLIHLLSS